MKNMPKVLFILTLGIALAGCGAIKAELSGRMADAVAADTAGWTLEMPLDEAYRKAFDYLKLKDAGKIRFEDAGGNFGAARRYISSGDNGKRLELTVDNLRVNGSGAFPEQAKCRLWKVAVHSKVGSEWKDVSAAESEAVAKDFLAFATGK